MNKLGYNLRFLSRIKINNIIRLISLTLGLVISLLVFPYISYQFSYNRFFSDSERVYQVYGMSDGGETETIVTHLSESIQNEIPEVEAVSRVFGIYRNPAYIGENRYSFAYIVADSTVFDVLDFGAITGDPEKILSRENHILISESLSKTMFGDENPQGKVILEGNTVPLVVYGVFRDLPVNNTLGNFNAICSFKYEEKNNASSWQQNQSYPLYIKLYKGTDPKVAEEKINRLSAEESQKIIYSLIPITQVYTKGENSIKTSLILATLAFLTLFIACMNYALISIASIIERSKVIAMLKCCGATKKEIFALFLYETGILLAVSCILSAVIILLCRNHIASIFSLNPADFLLQGISVPAGIIVTVFLLSGILPARLMSSIKLTSAFRGIKASNNKWKNALIFIQLTGVAFVCTFLLISVLQFHLMHKGDTGYEHNRLAYTVLTGNKGQIMNIQKRINGLPQIEMVGSSCNIPVFYYGTREIYNQASKQLMFTGFAEYASPSYVAVMGLKILQGENFRETSGPNEVLINSSFLEKAAWNGSPIGQQILESDSPDAKAYTVTGVVNDFRIGANDGLIYPMIFHNFNELLPSDSTETSNFYTLVRFRELTAESLSQVQQQLNNMGLAVNPVIVPYEQTLLGALYKEKGHQDLMIILSILVWIMALTGVIAYIGDEIKRRQKEIGIRKINGSTAGEIIRLFLKENSYTIFPAILTGTLGGYFWGEYWLHNFAHKITPGIWVFILIPVLMIIIIYIISILKLWKAANNNPVRLIIK